jgi:hypothetical protein
MTFAFCVVLIQNIVIFKKKRGGGGYVLKIITKLYVTRNDYTTSFCYKSYNNIGCDDDDEEEVDSDDMEYTEDAIDNMILEFSGD